MKRKRYYYLVRLEYLGFRYSGWQVQPKQRTVAGMIVKTLQFVLPTLKFKILSAGRTDAKVSSLDGAFELFTEAEALPELSSFTDLLNKNLPPDIRITSITPTTQDFNIIQNAKQKQYQYIFSYGKKSHPYCAPFLTTVLANLDIEIMKQGALLYQGTHDFSAYTAKLQLNTKVVRTITHCKIIQNTLITASFFPETSYLLSVEGAGFMRYQIRMMMGALFKIGSGEITLEQLSASLIPSNNFKLTSIAPGSGLVLNKLDFE